MRAVILKKPGDVNCLAVKEIDPPKTMSKNDLVIRHTCIGVEHDDVLMRRGVWEMDKKINPSAIIGLSGVGRIDKIGSAITRFKEGQRVGYAFGPPGSYCEKRVINANFCVAIPDDITDEHAAAIIRKGLAAHTMLFRCHVPNKGSTIMVTGAGSGVGQMIARWGKYAGLKVIGAIGNENKRDAAISAGCDFVINYTKENEAIEKMAEITNKMGVNAIYDSIGKDTFTFCLKTLHLFGMYVSYGIASGKLDNFDIGMLEGKSLFLTKPRFELYKSNRNELVISANELFDAYKKGAILTNVQRYAFSSVQQAHKDIENRQLTGAAVLTLDI